MAKIYYEIARPGSDQVCVLVDAESGSTRPCATATRIPSLDQGAASEMEGRSRRSSQAGA